MKRVYQIISALATFTPSLTKVRLTLTALINNILVARIKGITVTDAVSGVNGVWTTSGSITPVVGETYYLVIPSNIKDGGKARILHFQAQAETTVYADLVNKFVALVNAKHNPGVTASNSASHLRITETPYELDAIAGEVTIQQPTLKSTSGTSLATFSATTAHVTPIGQYAQVYRISQRAGVQFSGAPNASSTYTVIKVEQELDGKRVIDHIFVDSALTTAEKNYINSIAKNYNARLGLGEGATVAIVPTVTSASGTAVIPAGVDSVTVASANSGHFASIPDNLPVGTEIAIINGATAFKIALPAGEGLNGGTAAGSATVAASKVLKLKKTSVTNWYGAASPVAGTAPASTADDQAASA